MPLTFAAITPHPPVLMPNIGKDHGLQALNNTVQAFKQLEEELYLAKPQTIIVISPHEGRFDDAFVVNAHTDFTASFDKFGDAVTKNTYHGDPDLAAKISHLGNRTAFPIRLISAEAISHGTSILLHYLASKMPDTKVLPIGFSDQSVKDHIRFGEIIKDVIMESDKRIAVIASGDLSHTLTKDAPGGFDKQGASFDETLLELLDGNNMSGIMQMDQRVVKKSQACGYRCILILLGILKNMKTQYEGLSYEHPFGVGYAVGHFKL